MVRAFPVGILVAATLLLQAAAVLCGFPTTMILKRAFPTNHRVPLSQLIARDKMRHGRMLKSSNGVINFPVGGSFDPVMFYYTTVKLGSPPREFHVQIDTGSDFLWIQLNSFDPKKSSTASNLFCSDQRCSIAPQASDRPTCTAHDDQCNFFQKYGDLSTTSGIVVSDLFYFDKLAGTGYVNTNSSAPIVFGCSTEESGTLGAPFWGNYAVDGVLGFSQGNVSVISQLSAPGVAPKAFSHCLKGDETGGGTFVLGTVDEPNIAYTKIVPSEPQYYNVQLMNISVNGDIVSNISGFFSTPSERTTIIDSGTTYASIETIYIDSFVEAITSVLPKSAILADTASLFKCYRGITSDVFPQVGFHFDGGVSMVLEPKDYLINDTTIDDDQAWCIAFQEGDATILGDLFLKDKIVAYDLVGQRIGWANYDCSKAVKVTASTSSGIETVTIQPPITPSSSPNPTSSTNPTSSKNATSPISSKNPSPNIYKPSSSSINEPPKLMQIYLVMSIMLISFLLI